MKKLLLTMVTLLSMTAMTAQTSNGERKAPKKMTHEEMTTQMVSQLKLNDAQKTKVAALNKEYQDYLMPEPPQKPEGQAGSDGDKAKQKKAGNKKQSAGNHQAKRQEYEKKLKTILTDDQYKSYQKMGAQGKGNGSKPKQKTQTNS
ncbi:MAG: DUF4890 domain-containing protein [Prevotella sp.]|nr:DUF4890 domain-containing protein [Prevotella sp.]